jgi:ribosomal protein S7
MSGNESTHIQSIKELEWLAQFYDMHGRKDLAEKIWRDLDNIHKTAKNSKFLKWSKTLNNIKPDSSDFASPG